MSEQIEKIHLDKFIAEYSSLLPEDVEIDEISIDEFEFELRIFYHEIPKETKTVPQKCLAVGPDGVAFHENDTFGYSYAIE